MSVNTKNAEIEIAVNKENIGRAIGRQGSNLSKMKFIIDRHFVGVKRIKVIRKSEKITNN